MRRPTNQNRSTGTAVPRQLTGSPATPSIRPFKLRAFFPRPSAIGKSRNHSGSSPRYPHFFHTATI